MVVISVIHLSEEQENTERKHFLFKITDDLVSLVTVFFFLQSNCKINSSEINKGNRFNLLRKLSDTV